MPLRSVQSASRHRGWLQRCIDLLNDRPQLIFYGPPGTGKTYIAQRLAKHVAGDNVRLVQFHPTYSYEDFFEGFRPLESGGFTLNPGPMRRLVEKAIANPAVPHVLIIDEINRANLAKVFGELYFLLEYRDHNVELLYSDGDFSLPQNIFIIGTMNTADRSIALVDAAMRRRFAFVALHPSEPPTNGVLRSWLAAERLPARSAELLDQINARIDDADFAIGPSYFMRASVHEPGGLELAWHTAILPLLEEHHYGELDRGEVVARYGLDAIARAVDGAPVTESALDDDDVRRLSMLRQLILRENDPPRAVRLTADEADALRGAELANLSRTPGSTDWDVAAGKKVGVVTVGDLQITIKPKVPINGCSSWSDMPSTPGCGAIHRRTRQRSWTCRTRLHDAFASWTCAQSSRA